MIEVVFNDSAYGSLQVGQSYGVGKYQGGATSVLFLRKEGDSQPTEEEMREAQRQAEKKARRDWDNAVPLGGKQSDLYCFDIALSIGEITETEIGSQRRAVLEMMHSIWSLDNLAQQIDEKLQNTRDSLVSLLKRCAAGEPIRIWYSHNPDEMCGMFWLISQLRPIKNRGSVYLVKLPEWEYRDESTICSYNGWGDIGPGEWGRYQAIQQEAKPAFFSLCAAKWSQLKEENAPLRVFLNGHLQSAAEDIYDSYINREIDKQPETFVEAMVVGDVLGRYQLGIGAVWVSLRIEKMIEQGILTVAEKAPAEEPIYRQKLHKTLVD